MRLPVVTLCCVCLALSTAQAAPPATQVSPKDYAFDVEDKTPVDMEKLPSRAPTLVESYGPDSLQFGELRVPKGAGPFPVAAIVHGGCWTRGWATHRGFSALSTALADRGIATWNIEYRQLGDAGAGWPGTFLDWGAGLDHLRQLAGRYPLDLKRVIVIGHSAGAHAALWLGSRPKLPAKSEIRGANPLPVQLVVALDGPGDVTKFTDAAPHCDQSTIWTLFGGFPYQQTTRFEQGNPVQMLPSGVPTVLVSSEVLRPEDAENYRAVAAAKGDSIELLEFQTVGHFALTNPETPSGKTVLSLIEQSVGFMTH